VILDRFHRTLPVLHNTSQTERIGAGKYGRYGIAPWPKTGTFCTAKTGPPQTYRE
jgi:hypothetical protein